MFRAASVPPKNAVTAPRIGGRHGGTVIQNHLISEEQALSDKTTSDGRGYFVTSSNDKTLPI